MATEAVAPRKGGGNIREIRIEGEFAYVPLTKGYEAKIDVAAIPLIEGRNWSACIVGRAKKRVYAVVGLRVGRNKTRLGYMHRVICPGPAVDHIDRDTLNNTQANLRSCTLAENNRNIAARRDNKLQVKGVCAAAHGGYRTAVRLNGETVYSATFATIEEARIAYDREARKAFGEFAFVNGAELP